MTAKAIREKLYALADKQKAEGLQRFFKTGPGEYAQGDRFIGVQVPQIRKLVKAYPDTALNDIKWMLYSDVHEERLLALLLMVQQYQGGNIECRRSRYKLYLASTEMINNWDLVDVTAEHIVGAWLFERSRKPLYKLAGSESLWERRIAIMATFHFIKHHEFEETLKLAVLLRDDKHDLIHKAVGWMLREIGKRDRQVEEAFLQQHYRVMPRTMLRYAIEKFPEKLRQDYLKGNV
ncbi:MAG: DNA alkylation repair protein [Pseudomonadota bacterium]